MLEILSSIWLSLPDCKFFYYVPAAMLVLALDLLIHSLFGKDF
jgi:hypothetical protein